jgi:hypothetical protein
MAISPILRLMPLYSQWDNGPMSAAQTSLDQRAL